MTYQPRDITPIRRREKVIIKSSREPLSKIIQAASRREGEFMLTFALALSFFGVLYLALIMAGGQ